MKTRLALLAVCLFAVAAMAHVRLHNPSTKAELYWSNPSNVSIVINDAGSDDVDDASAEIALQNAIDAWNRVDGSEARLVENTSPAQKGRTDWSSSSVHLMMFDETNSSGYFPNGSGTVALTPIWFYGNGTISDADVLFNGKGFNFTTQGGFGGFDIQDVATHELGHLLGLDHSGVVGSSMYPYVDPSVILHRSLSTDDEHGMRDMYPDTSFATLVGRVRRSGGGANVQGALVVARDVDGRVAGSTLTNSTGNYTIAGLDAGTYTVYARPLDAPVSNANLTPGHTVETNFEATYDPTPMTVTAGQLGNLGDLYVGSDVSISLGRTSDSLPLRAVRGASNALQLHGAGLLSGSTLLAPGSGCSVSSTSFMNSVVNFSVFVPSNAAPGLVDLEVIDFAGRRSILPGALEITPPDPVVTSVSPPSGDVGTATSVIIKGANFYPGARVVIGNRVYVDGDLNGCSVLDPTTILLSVSNTVAGEHDVVVIDSTGVEGRLSNAFVSAVLPSVSTVFPVAGNRDGGTDMVLRGTNFTSDIIVRIDGIVQSNVVVDSTERVIVTTEGGAEGGPYLLEVENPGGGVATSAFSYVRPEDPRIDAISETTGPKSGGALVTLTGANFAGATVVVFGADPDTGLGGVEATSTSLVNASTLIVEVPPNSGGTKSVLVRRPDTEQASVLAAAYTYTGGGKSGGGCVGSLGASTPTDLFNGALWLVSLGLVLGWKRRSPRAPVASH